MRAVLVLLGFMFSVLPAAAEQLYYDFKTKGFKVDFAQRDQGELALQLKQYDKAAKFFKRSFESMPSQKALYYYRYALLRTKPSAQPIKIASENGLQIRSSYPMKEICVGYRAVLSLKYPCDETSTFAWFLFTQWQSDQVETHLTPQLLSYLAQSADVLALQPFAAQTRLQPLPAKMVNSHKLAMGFYAKSQPFFSLSSGVYATIKASLVAHQTTLLDLNEQKKIIDNERLCRTTMIQECDTGLLSKHRKDGVLAQGKRLRMYLTVSSQNLSNARLEVEVLVAMLDLMDKKTLAVNAFYYRSPKVTLQNKKARVSVLQDRLAKDIMLFTDNFMQELTQ
ncbi:MAG: hypothetical protein ACI8WB_004081 [Phenylobacterium sp.]|jgi:hypothetical protein